MNSEFLIKVIEYQNGNDAAMGYLVGCVVKATKGKINPADINTILKTIYPQNKPMAIQLDKDAYAAFNRELAYEQFMEHLDKLSKLNKKPFHFYPSPDYPSGTTWLIEYKKEIDKPKDKPNE